MDGKVVVVTGATSGVGKETARRLSQMGATVILVGRSAEKGRKTLDEIRRTAKVPAHVSYLRADFAKLDEVRALAAELAEKHRKVDVLINNAGVVNQKRRTTVDGFEETFAVNHLAHFLLTGLLFDRLRLAPQARIINVSSDAHRFGWVRLNDLNRKRGYHGMFVYGASKMANLYFTYELARRLHGTNITANALHPGAVASGFSLNNGWMASLAMKALRPFFISPAKAADTPVWLASDPALATVTGKYFVKMREARSNQRSRDRNIAAGLWRASESMTKLIWPQ